MSSAGEVAFSLLRRLLGGEDGSAAVQLGLLLEKSSALDAGEEHYREVLPPEVANLRLSPETSAEIVSILCEEISRDPREPLITAASFTGADAATRTAVALLTEPPRPLTMGETRNALAIASSFLPWRLRDDPGFLPRATLERLVARLEELQHVEEATAGVDDREARIGVRHHATSLLEALR